MSRHSSSPSSPARTVSQEAEVAQARRAMVHRLEEQGVLSDALLREALLEVPREVLLPRAYVRRDAGYPEPVVLELLDGAHPEDRQEWLELIYSGASVLAQRNGEALDGQVRGRVKGGRITSQTSVVSMTVQMLHDLQLRPGLSYLELGAGPGYSAALAARVLGAGRVTAVERDAEMASAAARRLAALGLEVDVVAGDGLDGYPERAPYERIAFAFSVPYLPVRVVEQLAEGGLMLAHLTADSPSWPGLVTVCKDRGRLEASVCGSRLGHAPVHGHSWVSLHRHKARVGTEPGRHRTGPLAPPPEETRGFWLALAHLVPGLVRDFSADHLTLIAPRENSWAVVGPDGDVEEVGSRPVWDEVCEVYARWERAGRPETYRLEFAFDGRQYITAGAGTGMLAWELPTPVGFIDEGEGERG
ncbi:protein-L-isoaspartate O-methyltransferase family protein [Streptomyces sp. XH2]|uniref:protein-L-isoaspartate O-methyltransferase family protein n=1 Tax=Streptomyces sp. XH2 TaxID=3412483 RepID=UPI003C7E9FE5